MSTRAARKGPLRYHFTFARRALRRPVPRPAPPARILADPMSFIQNNWMLILVAFLSGAMLVWPLVQRRFSPMKDIGNLNATHLINHKDAVLLDVRETKEYEGGRLPNAVHIPLSQLDGRAVELVKYKGRPVIAYCASGARARMAGNALAKHGFTEIYNLDGGVRAWKDAGLPLEKSA